MNERLVALPIYAADPTEGSAVGALAQYIMVPFEAVLVYATVGPYADDSGATMDINNGATELVAGIACATKNAPGEWAAKGYGGANEPIAIAAGSELTIDFNSAAAANAFSGYLLVTAGEKWG